VSKENQEIFNKMNGSVIILRKEEFIKRNVKLFEIYDPVKHKSLDYFIKTNYLIDIDLFTPWNFQHHLIFGKHVVFLALDNYIDYKKDMERVNFMQLRIQKRLYDPYNEKLQFALIELPYFPEMRDYLNLKPNEHGVHFFAKDFNTGKFYVLDKEFMTDSNTIDTNVLVEFCSDVINKRVSPYKQSDTSISEPFDKHGVRTFNHYSLEAYFSNKLYLE
jgi:hypothetical protein